MNSISLRLAVCWAVMPTISSLSWPACSRSCAFCPAREERRNSKSLRSPSMMRATSRSSARLVSRSGKSMLWSPSRSAARRALRAKSSSSPLVMIARFARVTVWSRRATISPALTRSPSRTPPPTPPVGCCTFLTLESTTIDPDAISAPESEVVLAQPPTPKARMATTVRPARILRRMERRVGVVDVGLMLPTALCAPGFGDDLERPRRRLAMEHLGEHLVLRTEGDAAPFLHGKNEVDPGDRARPMCDHDRNPAPSADAENSLRQSRIALGIEIGVGLVEHDEEGIAIERARKRDALGLARREGGAALPDKGVIAVLERDDHVVDAGSSGGGANRFRVGIGLEAADVLRHSAVEEFQMLGQVADIATERIRRPLVERGAVEADLALRQGPISHQHAGEG